MVDRSSNPGSQRIPNFLKAKSLEILLIHRGKSIYSMVLEREGEARVDDVPVSGFGIGCIGPEVLGNLGIVVDASPGGVLLQGEAIACGFGSGVGPLKDGWIAKQHVELDENEFAKDKLLFRSLQGFEEVSGLCMQRRVWIRRMDEDVGIGGEHSAIPQMTLLCRLRLGMYGRRIHEVATTSAENRHLPCLLNFGFGDGLHIGLHSPPYQLSNGPVSGAGNALDLMKERLW